MEGVSKGNIAQCVNGLGPLQEDVLSRGFSTFAWRRLWQPPTQLRTYAEHYTPMHTIEELRTAVETALGRIEYPPRPFGLFEPIRYTLESGGKRLRPTLVLAVYDWLTPETTPVEAILPAAVAVEVFHNFTLLHDDIMDRSDLRRGRPTVVNRWGDNVAILSGDAMCILAYQLLAQAPAQLLAGLMQRFNHLALGVCQGQQWDMEFEGASDLPIASYLEMVEYKTAALIEGSIRMGAYAAQASETIEELLAQSGRELGIAFQLQDDLLDVYGQTEILGKNCGDDIADNKITYLSLLASQHASPEQRQELSQLAGDKEIVRHEKVSRTVAIYNALGIKQLAEEEIEHRLTLSRQYLEQAETAAGQPTPVLHQLFAQLAGRAY